MKKTKAFLYLLITIGGFVFLVFLFGVVLKFLFNVFLLGWYLI